MYYARYTDTELNNKTILRKTVGAGQELLFTVYDENGSVVNLTTVTTNMKIYIGANDALQVTGGTLTLVGEATLGTVKYALETTDFDAESDAGTYPVELQFGTAAAIADSTSTIRAGDLCLTVEDTIAD